MARRKYLRRFVRRRLELSGKQILAWADAWFQRTNQWPKKHSGWIPGTDGEKWANVDQSLRSGRRGLPGGSSLARLLKEHRRVRNHKDLPRLTIQQILVWAQAHYQATGTWPKATSGVIAGTRDETWNGIETALRDGLRGLSGGSSLAQVLARFRGVRNEKDLPFFTIEQILAWVDSYHERTGKWPTYRDGLIIDSQGETWNAVHLALRDGTRGLVGGSSLAQLLTQYRGVRNSKRLPDLTEGQILTWADNHHQCTGSWPTRRSGPIVEAPGETWLIIDKALCLGRRGLPGGSSLPRFLKEHRGRRLYQFRPDLTEKQVLAWADAHYQRTGQWPNIRSGSIPESSGVTWLSVHRDLVKGYRGFPGGSSLRQFLEEHGRNR